MKRLFISLAVLTVAAMACTKTENSRDGAVDGPVPVRLSSGLALPSSKAVIDNGSTFTASIGAWESDDAADFAQPVSWINTAEITATSANPGNAVVLDPERYYSADDNISTYMMAWCPAGNPEEGIVSFENTDGQTDPIISGIVSGSKTDAASKNLVFTHPTTQLKFEVKGDASLEAGTQIRSISVKSAQLPDGFDLASGSVTYADAADLEVPGITPAVIGSTAAPAGNPVMIKPFEDNQISLDISTSAADYKNVTATIDDTAFQPGKAYTITLTFVQREILLSATVSQWDNTGTGSATIE